MVVSPSTILISPRITWIVVVTSPVISWIVIIVAPIVPRIVVIVIVPMTFQTSVPAPLAFAIAASAIDVA